MQDTLPETDNHAVLTCPECGKKEKAVMPTEAKQHFFKCTDDQCGADIATKEEDCCIFCSYSNKKCPFKQINPNEDERPKLQSLI